ncbi:thiamine pyrophosphate-dependent dehydrogenase E1 component subunit alpha [Actinosynnema sp. NPDC023658]|uniref:thiamine pyrophosphate-dependent dehydrogenase E1 component subunit alpha n=1 Tax=Actinosynnema sp. NPDC023658 TaxID=3155465 RepID=UPI0033E45723
MTKAELLAAYRTMFLTRVFEEEILAMTAVGLVPGYVHPCTGHEAVAAGVLAGRMPEEWVVSYYRCHGHALACGSDPLAVMREVLTRRGGLCGGKGGSMHLADRANRFLGASSIVAAQLPIAAGVALNEQRAGDGRAVVVFCGDGALGAGVAYETLTTARHLGLPLLVVCEDNGWQDHTPSHEVSSLPPAGLVAGLGIGHREVDGNDVTATARAAAELLADCRAGAGPRVLVAHTYLRHFHAQSGADAPAEYRPAAEVDHWRRRDPLDVAANELIALGVDPEPVRAEVAEEVSRVVAAALATPEPEPSSATTSVAVAGWVGPF